MARKKGKTRPNSKSKKRKIHTKKKSIKKTNPTQKTNKKVKQIKKKVKRNLKKVDLHKIIKKDKPKSKSIIPKKESTPFIDTNKPKKQIIPPRTIDKQYEDKKIIKRPDFKNFLLILFLIIGGVASYVFRNIYVYSLSGLVVLLLLFFIIKSKKRINKKKEKIIKKRIIEKKIYLTEFDKFYNYVLDNNSVSLCKIARVFKMPKKQAEEWARILEGRGLILIYYPLIGDSELRCPN